MSAPPAIGQGLETAFAQIAADALEVPMDRIKGVLHGTTSYVSDGYGAYHSRSVVMGGSAMLDAAKNLRAAIRAAAAERLGCAPSEVEIVDGSKAVGPGGKSVPLKGLSRDGISAEGAFLNKKHTYTYGAHAAHVAVDPKLGHVELIDYVIVEDCGRAINPLTVHGQAIGSAVQGLGGAFMEHLVYDQQGQLLTGSLADYLIPTASDFPNIRAVVLEDHPSPINPLGAKGAGEGGIIAAGGVMANAVANALGAFGVHLTELPLTPTRIWEVVQAGSERDNDVAAGMTAACRRIVDRRGRPGRSLDSHNELHRQERDMSVARHPRPPELEGVPVEEIMQKYVGRFREKKPDWAAFEDAKIEGYKRAQHRFIGAGGSGKHGDPTVIPAKNFTLSIMYVEPGQGNAAHTHEVEECFFVLQGFLDVFVEDESGKRITTRLGPWECISCPAGVIHGYQNDSLGPVYFQVMLGRAKPDTMGYADDELYKRRDAHLKAV